ncbi:urethanase-like, partial [Saccoglossus kowalevskii]|uniref:Glutamyl-tRNA(Gln) amidotransferase subunit A, chloroplastic/mitochondrial-like n=1 Tax=Saccoglossus kowalevskii TaxID=10224 RepID=A0ABM0MFQ5_SACKO
MIRALSRFSPSLHCRSKHFLPRAAQRLTSTSNQNEDSIVDDKDIYRFPAMQVPSLTRLKEIANNNGLDVNDEDLNHYRDFIENVVGNAMNIMDSYPQPTLPVKYPRTPGYRPTEDENQHNGWYWRCDIKGADTGILKGKTIAVKDNIPLAGVPMMNGSYVLEGYVPDYDATVITKVLDAGGQITGKTSCEDLCFSGVGFVRAKGAVRNPHNMNYAAGGSSSGSASLVASGHVDMALGADQGGSIRIPSSWCGVVGFKPTFGLVPYTGISQMEYTADHTGPIAKNVYDCALLLETIAGLDGGLDPRQPANLTVPEYTKGFGMKLPGIKIGVLKEGFIRPETEPDVAAMVKKSAFQMITLGAKVEEVSVPMHMHAVYIFKSFFIQGHYDMVLKGNGIGSQHNGFYSTNLAVALHKGFKTRINDMSHVLK